MKGVVYLDNDGNLGFRNDYFLEEVDPGFWTRNRHLVSQVWKFDTEDVSCMKNLLTSFKTRNLSAIGVRDFCRSINFDISSFMLQNADVKTGSDHFSTL